jgi:hypothetical protein
MINDVRALHVPGALEAVLHTDAAVCLMHMQGEPRSMQQSPAYVDVVSEVRDVPAARARGVRGRRESRTIASRSIRASASARRLRTTSHCARGPGNDSRRSAIRSSRDGRASRLLAR